MMWFGPPPLRRSAHPRRESTTSSGLVGVGRVRAGTRHAKWGVEDAPVEEGRGLRAARAAKERAG